MTLRLKPTILAVSLGFCGATAAFADDDNTLVADNGQSRVWHFVKTDSSSTFLSIEETASLEIPQVNPSNRMTIIEDIEPLAEPTIVRTKATFSDDLPTWNYDLAPDSRAYIGLPERTEAERDTIEYRKLNQYRSAKMPAGRYVEPLYTVAGAGIQTRF